MVFRSSPGQRTGRAKARPGGTAEGFTDEVAELVPVEASGALDASVRALARQIASRLMIPRPKRDARSQRGAGALASMPYRRGSDEIDLDKTIEMLAERPVPDDEDIIVRERVRTRRALVLVVDASGSMKGERIRTAAAVVGALAGELAHDDLAVIAFWSDAAVLQKFGQQQSPDRLLDLLTSIPARGLTNVGFPLELAAAELRQRPAQDARVLLLSDCVHNAGPTRAPSPRVCPGSTCCSTSAASTTKNSRANCRRLARAPCRP
ncbi:MAG: vWA domain-containing protein [Microcella pacifica]